MKAYGQQSVEVTKKIFMKMSRTDLVEQFSGTSSGLKEKNFWCEPESAQFERVPASHDVKQILWETLDTLSYKELRRFMWSLQFMHFKKSIPHKSVYQQKRVHMTQQLVNLMMEKHGQQSVEAVKEILKDMNRTDLVERLSKTSSGRTGRGAELDSRHRGERAFSRDPSDKDPSDWTKLDPEVNSTHTDEAPTYSLQSEVGNFECSVSGLRWSCKVKVSFKYQFCSWEEHMERMENMQYMPAGPLIDITVIVGKLAIVYLPHWICIDDDPRILDKFAVLHIDDCGDVVEKVSEVTSSHVKLSEPVFSPRAVLMKVGFPVKISCNVLIYYKPNTSFLKLHVYLIPHDPALKQTVDKNEFSQGYEIIRKLRPDKHLKMQHGFMLTADIDTAKIQPEKITLRYESQHPNFYEVYIKNPDGNLCITLSYSPRNKGEPKCEHVWTCEIQKDDYSTCAPLGEEDGHCSAVNQKATTTKQSSSGLTAKDFVDKHKVELIKRVSNIAAILDELSTVCGGDHVLMDMNRTDLVQKLPETSSELKAYVQHLHFILHHVETMAAEMLLTQTLNDLSSEEFGIFKSHLELEESFPGISRGKLKEANSQDVVDLMMEAYSQPEWLEVTRKILKKMKRSDLEQRLEGFDQVETMTSVLELLLETLNDLTDRETQDLYQGLLRQIHHHEPYRDHVWTDMEDTVFSMVKTFGQQSVIKTMEVLRRINRTDLMQTLSDKSSISKRKHPDDTSLSALIHKVATIAAVNELLLETLNDLDQKELKKFMRLERITWFHRGLRFYPWRQLMTTHRVEIVDLMMAKYGQQSVEVTRDVLMDMNKTDLAQKLTETSSELKESSTETLDVKTTECMCLIKTFILYNKLSNIVETMTSVIEQILETLAGFGQIEIEHFKKLVLSEMYSHNYLNIEKVTDVQDCVFYIVETYGLKSVEKTKEILEKMKKTDLVHRLSDISSGPKSKTVATMAAVKQLLLETLNGLSEEKLRIFNEFLRSSSQKVFLLRQTADRAEVVDLIMKAYGQQSVEVTKKIFMKMSRTDLVEQFSGTSSGLKVSLTSHTAAFIQLIYKELRRFMWSLQFMHFKKSIPHKSVYQEERVNMTQQLVNLMMERHGQQSVEAVREILKDMNRTDLVERLSKTSSGRTDDGTSHTDICPSMMDPSDWTKLDPEVNSAHTDEAPTYSLQSEVGNFECSVSGLRWSCKEKVSFKYQFCSWEEHMERMENMQYMPAGPLIDITVIVGKLAIVYLPHWICIDDDPRILEKFAVLHIDDCGDVVEKVSEVTSSHVKLSEPVFSPRAVLMKVGFPVKISCNVLIYYKPNTSFLKLHVYLIPHDPALKQTVDKNEFSQGYEIIRKPRPDKHLKMQHGFMLTADIDTAKIQPEKITLRYESQHPNFYEVYIKNPDGNLCITLSYSPRNKGEPKCEHVWTCEIQKDDYSTCAPLGEEDGHCSAVNQKATTTKQSSSGLTAKHFVDKHKVELIKRVSHIAAILDELLYKDVIQQEVYDHIRAIRTPQDKMRELFSGPLKASVACNDAFYKILEKNEPYLIKDLKENN
ncbi:hypothetical protein Q8A73_007610 [Channa argus]|nr:hypothetical protein Q8A73_007610 [Channa argus]